MTCIWGAFDLLVFKVILGSFGALVPKMACNSKMAGCRAKQSEFWDLWILVTHIRGKFDLVGFKVI